MSRLQLLTGLSQEHSRPRPLLESSNLLQDSHLSLTENDENAVLWPLDPNGLGTETGADGGNQGRLRAAQSPAPPRRPLPAAPPPPPPPPPHPRLASEARSSSTLGQLHRKSQKSKCHRHSSAKATVEQYPLFQNSPNHLRGSAQKEGIQRQQPRLQTRNSSNLHF